MRIFQKIRENLKFFTWKNEVESKLINQKYNHIFIELEKFKLKKNKPLDYEEIIHKIENLLSEERDYRHVGRIEQLLILLYDSEEIEIALKVKLIEAKKLIDKELWEFYQNESEIQKEQAKTELLFALNNQLNSILIKESFMDRCREKARLRITLFFIFSLFLFLLDQLPILADFLKIEKGKKSDFIIIAMSSGWMGSSFSMLINLQRRIQKSSIIELKNMIKYNYILSRTLIGMVSGLFLFYFLLSGLLAGHFFPAFSLTDTGSMLDDRGRSLLMIWCFISGFSEKLIPDIITKTEKRFSENEEI